MHRADRRKGKQLVLDLSPPRPATRGGARKGAGRKKGPRPRVWHRRRPPHDARHPVHITLRARSGLPSFRQQRIRSLVRSLLHDQRKAPRGYRHSFQVAHFTIQSDHIHLVVEAINAPDGVVLPPGFNSGRALRSGVSGFEIAFALRLKKMLRLKKLKVWDSRYHRHDLRTPTETKNALRYVFQNAKKHGMIFFGDGAVDIFSSAVYFNGWSDEACTILEARPWPEVKAKTWLLGAGWQRAGPLFTYDRPAG